MPDCEIAPRVEEEEAPDILTKVKVLPPFQVAYEGNAYWPGSTPTVPESLARNWILNRWVERV